MALSKNLNGNILYRDTLDTVCKERYLEKLKDIDGKDPYEMSKDEWSVDMSKWPEVGEHGYRHIIIL